MGKIIKVDKLEIGMILGENAIDDKTGAILIPKNKALTRALINNLKSNHVYKVHIKDDEIPMHLINEEFVGEYQQLGKKLDNIFDMVKKDEKFEAKAIIAEMNSFVDEVMDINNISTQMKLLKEKDDYTFDHSMGVSILAITLGKWLGYDKESIFDLSLAALFHDLGKLKIPDEILNKPGKLTADEFEIMKKHVEYSHEILVEAGDYNDEILLGVLQHHEKINGTGYPYGLKGDEISEYARVIAVCDIYHAITSNRIYKYKDSPFTAADFLRGESFQYLDPYIVNVFLDNLSKFYVGNKVLLSNGTIGTIIYIHPQSNTNPIVQVEDKFIDFLKEDELKIIDTIL